MPSQARQGKARQSNLDELMARQGEAFLFGKDSMETNTFDYIWALLDPQGEYKRRRQACERLWQGYSIDKQRAIYNGIKTKIRQGEYVNPNPYFAIEDNAIGMAAKALPAAHPTNYNGARSMPDEAMVRAIYNGIGGIYTLREAEMYGMDIKGEFVL